MKLSYTANNRYKDCPRKYYLHYLRNLREEMTGSALVFGGAVDEGLNALLQGNPEYDIEFERAWLKYYKDEKIKYSKSDYAPDILTDDDKESIEEGDHPCWVSLKRKGLMILEAYKEQVLPHLEEVLLVQKYVEIVNDNGDKIIGYIDLVAKYKGEIVIFDNKTSSQKYKPDSVRTSDQLATYFEVDLKDITPTKAGYIVIPKNFRKKKEPIIPIEIIVDDIDDETFDNIFQQYQETLKGIQFGDFSPNYEGCYKKPFGCPYANYCHTGSTEGLIETPK